MGGTRWGVMADNLLVLSEVQDETNGRQLAGVVRGTRWDLPVLSDNLW